MASLRQLVQAARSLERELAHREAALAEALEQLHDPAVIRHAFAAGQQEERQRLVALIDLQLEQLQRSGLNALSLHSLRRQMLDPDAA